MAHPPSMWLHGLELEDPRLAGVCCVLVPVSMSFLNTVQLPTSCRRAAAASVQQQSPPPHKRAAYGKTPIRCSASSPRHHQVTHRQDATPGTHCHHHARTPKGQNSLLHALPTSGASPSSAAEIASLCVPTGASSARSGMTSASGQAREPDAGPSRMGT